MTRTSSENAPSADVIVRGSADGFAQTIQAGSHRLHADEPESVGGTNTGATPYDLLLAALGSCKAMTVGLYARRKKWPLEQITVSLRHSKIHAVDCAECETKAGRIDRIECEIQLTGSITAEQRSRLLEIADMCPVHRTLKAEIEIKTQLI
jgi:putative redox protein